MNVIEVNGMSKKFRLGAGAGDMRDRFKKMFSRDPEAQTARDFWALQDISFKGAQGESFGVIGHNGSGKSTLLKLLTGIYTPTSGTFKTQGRVAALIEVGAGFHQDLTGRENVYLNGSVLGMKKREIDQRYDEIVAFAELEKFMDTPVKRYSSGMYMRLGFAVAAHINPDIVLVDEVLAVGDESFQNKCMKRMLELHQEGKTIIFISHSMDAVAAMCQRVMLLSRGQTLAVGEPNEVISAYRTSQLLAQEARNPGASQEGELAIGSKDVEIVDVSLWNSNGEKCDTVTLGEPVQVRCRYRANVRIDDPAFGVGIYRADDLYIFGANTRFDELSLDPLEGEGEFVLTYESMVLLQGMYHISVAIYRRTQTNYPIDVMHKVLPMIVVSRTLSKGVVELPHNWKATRLLSDSDAMPVVIGAGS
jgi:lipopolysaccharide transport system ATP-binding protein